MFGKFLMDEGVATAEQIVAALDEQVAQTPPFGKIALHHKLLTVHQIWEILNHQADHGGRFGEIGVTLGYLTERQVQEILVQQIESRPKLGEVLVQQGVLDADALTTLLEKYRLRRLTDAIGPTPEGEEEEWPAEGASGTLVLAGSVVDDVSGM